MDLEHVKTAARRHLGRSDELIPHAGHVGTIHCLGDLVGGRPRDSRRSHHRPVAVGERRIALLPAELRRSLGAGMADLGADSGFRLAMHEVDQPFPGGLVFG